MATVRDIIDLFRSLSTPQANEFELFKKHLPLINAGQRKLWQVLTSRKPMNNWFVVFSQASNGAGADYFAPLAVGTREYALPPNFHHLRLIEPLSTGYENVLFTKTSMDSPDFRAGRALTSANQFGSEALYDIIGVNPGRMMLAQYPPAAIELRLSYVRICTPFTAITDVLTDFPDMAPELIARWCATQLLLGNDFDKWQSFEGQWRSEIDQFVFGETRDDTGPSIAEGFLE